MDPNEGNSKSQDMDNNKTKIIEAVGTSGQETVPNLNDTIAYMFNNQLMSDVQFQMENQDHQIKTFYAHKLILSMRSTVFDRMFNGSKCSIENPQIVNIQGISPENFSEFLKFVYTDKYIPSAENVKGACAVLRAAIQYNIPKLIQQCREFIKANIRPTEIFSIKRIASLICPDLVSHCNVMIDQEAAQIIQSKEFLEINNDELCDFLQRDGLVVSELELFKAMMKWATKRCEPNMTPGYPKILRDVLGRALFLIRFPRMTLPDFAVHVISQNLLTTKEERDVLYYLALKVANNPSTELPKTAFNCTKRIEPLTHKCQSCSSGSLVVSGSICPYCGQRCDY